MKAKNKISIVFLLTLIWVSTTLLQAQESRSTIENPSKYIAKISQFNFFVEGNNLIIYWSTTSEKNAFQFKVQRRNVDTKVWETKETILAYGNCNINRDYNYFEENPIIGTSIYRLKIIDINGNFEYSKEKIVEFNKQDITGGKELKAEFGLSQNYYNHYTATNKVIYTIPENCMVKLAIFNSEGKNIKSIFEDFVKAGEHQVAWKEYNLTPGIYFIRLTAETFNKTTLYNTTKKLLLTSLK